MKRIGILTGGGDAPGLNGIIEAVSKSLLSQDFEVIGICDGFEGVFEGQTKNITSQLVNGIHAEAGTFLGTSNRCGTEGREAEFLEKFKKLNLDGLIAAGGDGTFRGLQKFKQDIPLIGVPKTIDNDLPGTEATFGFDTACSVVAESIDALRATANAHRRILFVETMGRTAGWIALGGGLASYADAILIPERPFQRQALIDHIRRCKGHQRGLVIAVSEGAHAQGEDPTVAFHVEGAPEPERMGGVAQRLAKWVEMELDWEARHVVLGHLQRSHSPTTTDRFLTMALGVQAAKLAASGSWQQAIVYRDGRVIPTPIEDIMGQPRLVSTDHRWVKMAQSVGIFI